MKVMKGSWSLSGCCGRFARGGRGARGAFAGVSASPFGSAAAAGAAAGFGSRAGAFVAGAFSVGAFEPRERRLAGGGALGTGIGADAALLAGAPRLRASRVAWRL